MSRRSRGGGGDRAPSSPPRGDRLWSVPGGPGPDRPSLLGYGVFGTDRRIGRVESVVEECGSARLEVNVSRWPARTMRVIPAVVAEVDHPARMVMVNLTRRQIEQAPGPSEGSDWRARTTRYYQPFLHDRLRGGSTDGGEGDRGSAVA